MYVCIHLCEYLGKYVCMYACMNACMYVSTHMFVTFMGTEFAQGAASRANLDAVSFELRTDLMQALGGELRHATNMQALPSVLRPRFDGQKRSGTMACYLPHSDDRCVNLQRTGEDNKKQDIIITYNGTGAVQAAWANGGSAYINCMGTITIATRSI